MNENVYVQPIHFVRFNPHNFKHGISRRTKVMNKRYTELKKILDNPPSMNEKIFGVTYMYYDTDSDGTLSILSKPECPEGFTNYLIEY